MKHVAWFSFFVALAQLPCAAPAHAQADGALARALFREGRSLMDAGDFQRACPKLEESLRLDPGIGTRFNLAHCWERLGRTASAWTTFLDVSAEARGGAEPEREAAARARAAALEPKLTRLRVEVAAVIDGLNVTLDGQQLRQAAWGTASPVDPGRHALEATAPGHREWSSEVDASAPGETLTVSVPALDEILATVDPAPPAHKDRALAVDDEPGIRADVAPANRAGHEVWAWVATGAGVVGLGAGATFLVLWRSARSRSDELCSGGPEGNECIRDRPADPLAPWDRGAAEGRDFREVQGEGNRWRTLSVVGFGAGAAALVTGIVLHVTAAGDATSEAGQSVSFWPTLGPQGLGAGARMTF